MAVTCGDDGKGSIKRPTYDAGDWVEPAPVVIVHEVVDGTYVERVRAAAGQRLRLTEPFAIDLDPAELTRRR